MRSPFVSSVVAVIALIVLCGSPECRADEAALQSVNVRELEDMGYTAFPLLYTDDTGMFQVVNKDGQYSVATCGIVLAPPAADHASAQLTIKPDTCGLSVWVSSSGVRAFSDEWHSQLEKSVPIRRINRAVQEADGLYGLNVTKAVHGNLEEAKTVMDHARQAMDQAIRDVKNQPQMPPQG